MSLSFSPLNEEEVLNLMKAGIYNFQVKNAEDTHSQKTGNPMIKLTLIVWDDEGRERTIFDYLMTSLMYKLKHFCDATGLENLYKSGTFTASDCIGKNGKCKVKIDEQEGYQPKNAIADYVMTNQGAVKVETGKHYSTYGAKPKEEFVDSDLPF